MKIPTPALDSFLLSVEEAAQLALDGNPAAGYECLLLGRQRALEAGQWEEPWSDQLEALWDRALERYAGRWGVGRA